MHIADPKFIHYASKHTPSFAKSAEEKKWTKMIKKLWKQQFLNIWGEDWKKQKRKTETTLIIAG